MLLHIDNDRTFKLSFSWHSVVLIRVYNGEDSNSANDQSGINQHSLTVFESENVPDPN